MESCSAKKMGPWDGRRRPRTLPLDCGLFVFEGLFDIGRHALERNRSGRGASTDVRFKHDSVHPGDKHPLT